MKLKLIHKLLLAMFACAALVLALTTIVTRASIGKGFEDFLQQQERSQVQPLVPELASWYSVRGSWNEMYENPRQFFNLVFTTLPQRLASEFEPDSKRPPPRARDGRPGQRPPGARSARLRPGPRGGPVPGVGGRNSLPQRIFLLDADMVPVIGEVPPEFSEDRLLAVETGDATVGWLGVASVRRVNLPEEKAFITRLRNNLLIGLLMGLAVAFLLAWLLARHLSKPVNEVAEGIRSLASGDFNKRLEVRGSDEIARLGVDVNRLSEALSEHETARKRWMSDMAHELRTPLAIINGELEAMSDGVRPLGKDQLDSVRDEVRHLSALVNDLQSLTLTDSGALAYKMQTIDFGVLVQMVTEASRARATTKGLEMHDLVPNRAVRLHGDEQRLRQLLGNLLDNSVRYTDAGGKISIELKKDRDQAKLTISDTAPGASAQECERLFERMYRMEVSRNRNSGGSGLGLAICRNIVDAHGGKISAEPGPDGGLKVTTVLPLEK